MLRIIAEESASMETKLDRLMRLQRDQEIYRPGSGPLKGANASNNKAGHKNDSCKSLNFSRQGRDYPDQSRDCAQNASFKKYDHGDHMESKYDRRMRQQREQELYRPGSGPLRRKDLNDLKASAKNDSCERLNISKDVKDDCEPNRDCIKNVLFCKYDNNFDRDKTNGKPDVNIYVPKQNLQSYAECDTANYEKDQKPMTRERYIVRENELNQRFDNHGKHSHRGSRDDISQWKKPGKDSIEFQRTPDSRGSERNTCNSTNNDQSYSYQGSEQSAGNFFSRYERNDRGGGGGNDKTRMGRNLSRHNSSNMPMLPDSFNNLPPRLQRSHLQSLGMNADEIEKYLNNLNSYGSTHRDNRYPQTLMCKNNRNSHFKMNKNKDPSRNTRIFQKSKYDETPESSTIPLTKTLPESTERRRESSESVKAAEKPRVEDNSANEDISSGGSASDDALLDDGDEILNWAEEVEREHQNVERNNYETDDCRANNDSTNDKKRERKKRRSFSYERKEPQRIRNPSESEYTNRRQEEDHQKNNNDVFHKTSESSNTDGYLSWRRNKVPSPTRTRLSIMTRNYRADNKFEIRDPSDPADRPNNKSRINSKISDLPSITKEIVNCSDKEGHISGIIKLSRGDLKCPPPLFPAPQPYSSHSNKPMKQLYNPTNPKQPIIISNQSGRLAMPATTQIVSHTNPNTEQAYIPVYLDPSVSSIVSEQYMMSRPAWYDAYSDSFRSTNNAHLLLDISRADSELQTLLLPGTVIHQWERVMALRIFLQEALMTLLTSDLKFCESENVEQHMWKILFHNVIELLRKCMLEDVNSLEYKNMLFSVIDKGTEYLLSLLALLEHNYKIKIDDFLLDDCQSTKPPGYAGLTLISAQKIFISLGDLARYKGNTDENSTYAVATKWYIKAHQLGPRNGKPYNQLATLAVYTKKVFDAVYYYMRSLMASNPFFTASDSLLGLFDQNRKRYEQVEKQRNEMKEMKKQEKAKEKESVINGSMLRKETWIRTDGRRIQRTTSTSHECNEESDVDELSNLSPVELYNRFRLSFLHVHGKLFSKVGLETLIEAAMEMLKEFKALLSHLPLPITTTRLIQLLALNMFAIENGQLKDPQIESGYHSAVQESALVISLQMFNLIINRCIQLLREQLQEMKADNRICQYPLIVGSDVQILLPAIKLWCDWLFCHTGVWNPPPSCQDYRISGCGDCWSRLAVLINILEELDYNEILKKNVFHGPVFVNSNESNDIVKITLEEDVTLRGFTPLMGKDSQPVYTHKEVDMKLAQICLRLNSISFFGTMYLCGLDPPVLKLQKTETGKSEYISVVEEIVTPKDQSDNDNAEEKWSDLEEEAGEDEEAEHIRENVSVTEKEDLLYRKKELERIHQKREKHIRDKKETINKEIAAFSVEMEIKPHYLVPDTNCFIDRITELEKIVKAISFSHKRPLYSLMVPLVVLSELEGIARDARKEEAVSEKAKFALNYLQNRSLGSNIKCVTTRGSVLPSTRFTSEEDYSKVENNDDKILTTCLNLCKHSSSTDYATDQPKKIYREVVLLTEDRNLRVKALSSNMPVQTVTDFITWAGLH